MGTRRAALNFNKKMAAELRAPKEQALIGSDITCDWIQNEWRYVIYKGKFILVSSHLRKMFLNSVGHMKMVYQYVFNETTFKCPII